MKACTKPVSNCLLWVEIACSMNDMVAMQVWVRQVEGPVGASIKGPMPTWLQDTSYSVKGRPERDLNRCTSPKIGTCRWKVFLLALHICFPYSCMHFDTLNPNHEYILIFTEQ